MPSLVETLDRLPPCLVRLVARDPKHPGRRMTLMAIADRAGLSYGTTDRISLKKSWATIQPDVIDAFCKACGVDLLRPGKTVRYLKRVLADSNGYKKLALKNGKGSPANVLRLLQSLSE